MADVPVTVCSTETCLTATVDAQGGVSLENPHPQGALSAPALKIGDGMTFAEFAAPLPNVPDFDAGTIVAIRLPPYDAGRAIVPGENATTSGFTLVTTPETVVGYNLLTYPPGTQQLRATAVSLKAPPLAIPPSLGLDIAYAAAPQGATFCPPAGISLPNSLGWPAGTLADVLVHGVDLTQDWAPYGGWAVVATAEVNHDGTRIETLPGEGIPVLSALGIRRR